MVLGLKRKSLIERIDAQLDVERRAVLNGELEKLEPLISDREKMVAELENTLDALEPDVARNIEKLQVKARRNAGLIRAAIEGITSANQRVAEIEAAHSNLSTYSAQGQVSNVACSKSSIVKKA